MRSSSALRWRWRSFSIVVSYTERSSACERSAVTSAACVRCGVGGASSIGGSLRTIACSDISRAGS